MAGNSLAVERGNHSTQASRNAMARARPSMAWRTGPASRTSAIGIAASLAADHAVMDPTRSQHRIGAQHRWSGHDRWQRRRTNARRQRAGNAATSRGGMPDLAERRPLFPGFQPFVGQLVEEFRQAPGSDN